MRRHYRHHGRRDRIRALLGVTTLLLALLPPVPAHAWKPITHVYLANQALKDALDDGKVTIYVLVRNPQGQLLTNPDGSAQIRRVGDYAVSDELKTALHDHRSNFWAGVIGPDAFPDLPTGQMIIHPPSDIGPGPDVNVDGHPDGSDAWLNYLWTKAHSAQWGTSQNLAFTFGFLCHAAGDLYAHTYINYYTGGIFDLNTNALRHITLEGYLLERTPKLEESLLPDGFHLPAGAPGLPIYSEVASSGLSGGVDQFIYANMMDADRTPGLWNILKGSNQTKSPPWIFSKLRQQARQAREQYAADLIDFDARYNHEIGQANDLGRAAEACGTFDFSCSAADSRFWEGFHRTEALSIAAEKLAYIAAHKPLDEYRRHWIDDIDTGLAAYPNVSLKVATALMFDPSTETKWDKAGDALKDFAPKLTSMAGAPDAVGDVMQFVSDLMAPIASLKDTIKSLVQDALDEFCLLAFGYKENDIKQYFLGPHAVLDTLFSTTGTHPPLTVTTANRDMFLADTGTNSIHPGSVTERFDWKKFAPAFNTVQLIKIAMMNPEEVDRLIHDIASNSVLSLAHPDPHWPSGTPPNIMVGFLRALDGSNQFVEGTSTASTYTPGMVLARDRTVYNSLFMPVINGQPDPLGNVMQSFVPPFRITSAPGNANSPEGMVSGGEQVILTASEAANWSLADTSRGDRLEEVSGSEGKQALLTVHNGVSVGATITVVALERGFRQRQRTYSLALLRDLVVTPQTIDLISGKSLKLETNVAPLAPARVVGHTGGGPRGPVTVSVAAVPGVTWQTMLAGQVVDTMVRNDGTFIAPTVTEPTFYIVRALRKDVAGVDPTTSFMGAARIQVLPPPRPLKIIAAQNLLPAGGSRRFGVTPNVPVTWKIVGDAAGCRFGTPDAPEAATAQQALSDLKSQLKLLHTKITAARVAPERLRMLTPVRRISFVPATGAAPAEPPSPTVVAAIQQRDDFIQTNKSAIIAHMQTLDQTLSTLTAPTSVAANKTITVQATATDGSGRTATTTITLVPNAPSGTPTKKASQPGTGTLASPLPLDVPRGAALEPSRTASFGKLYALDTDKRWAISVLKTEYSVQGYAIDAQNYYYCRPTEKFLKLTLLVKNVTTQLQAFDYQTVTAGGQGPDGDELAPTKNWKALDTGKLANRTVAPGATFEIEGVVTVPAQGDPKTLTFGSLRFDIADAVNAIIPLPAAIGGSNAAPSEAPAKADGTFYSLAFTDGAVRMARLPGRVGVSLMVRNATAKSLSVANANYSVELFDEDGDKYAPTKSTTLPVSLEPGATTTLHFAFDVPQAIKLKSLAVRERDGRIYVFPAGTL